MQHVFKRATPLMKSLLYFNYILCAMVYIKVNLVTIEYNLKFLFIEVNLFLRMSG